MHVMFLRNSLGTPSTIELGQYRYSVSEKRGSFILFRRNANIDFETKNVFYTRALGLLTAMQLDFLLQPIFGRGRELLK